jgi:hypothetical protein
VTGNQLVSCRGPVEDRRVKIPPRTVIDQTLAQASFAGGRGPGDMGVRADQQSIGRAVIGFGSADVDAMLPVPGGLAEV